MSPTTLSLEDCCRADAAQISRLWSVICHPSLATKHGFLRTGDDCVQKCPGGLAAGGREYVALGRGGRNLKFGLLKRLRPRR